MTRLTRYFAALSLIGAVLVGGGAEAGAGTVPTATCTDFAYPDLTTGWGANHCYSAAVATGYGGGDYHNGSAKNVLDRAGTDSVVSVSGHAFVENGPGGPQTGSAVGMAFLYPNSSSTTGDVLEGDPTAWDGVSNSSPVSAGPESVPWCYNNGKCVFMTYEAYPWATNAGSMYKNRLVLLNGCHTMNDSSRQSIGSLVFGYAQAQNVVGFTGSPATCSATSGPDCGVGGNAWEQTFWSDLGAGKTFGTAAVDATNRTGGAYETNTWKLDHNAGSQQSLSTSTGTIGYFGPNQRAATTGTQVSQTIDDAALTSSGPPQISANQAAAIAASQTKASLTGLTFTGAQFLDHGIFSEYRVTWAQFQNGAQLPHQVAVSVNAVTGKVVSDWSEQAPLTVGTTPTVTADQARSAALALVPGSVVVGQQLLVQSTPTAQGLVYQTKVNIPPTDPGKPHFVRDTYVNTDALTGASVPVAASE